MKHDIFHVAILRIYLAIVWYTTCMGVGTPLADPCGLDEENAVSFAFFEQGFSPVSVESEIR